MTETDPLFEAITKARRNGVGFESLSEELWKRFGETRAVLVLDFSGFTRTTQARGIVFFLWTVTPLREIILEAFHNNGALRTRRETDNLFAEFSTPDQALSAAFAIHQALEKEAVEMAEGENASAGIGIGYGPLLLSETEGMFGNEMNLASKLGEDLAQGGETLLTQAAFRRLPSKEKIAFEERRADISRTTFTYYAVRPRAA